MAFKVLCHQKKSENHYILINLSKGNRRPSKAVSGEIKASVAKGLCLLFLLKLP